MENKTKGLNAIMLGTAVGIIGIVVAVIDITVTIISIRLATRSADFEHKKSSRPQQGN